MSIDNPARAITRGAFCVLFSLMLGACGGGGGSGGDSTGGGGTGGGGTGGGGGGAGPSTFTIGGTATTSLGSLGECQKFCV